MCHGCAAVEHPGDLQVGIHHVRDHEAGGSDGARICQRQRIGEHIVGPHLSTVEVDDRLQDLQIGARKHHQRRRRNAHRQGLIGEGGEQRGVGDGGAVGDGGVDGDPKNERGHRGCGEGDEADHPTGAIGAAGGARKGSAGGDRILDGTPADIGRQVVVDGDHGGCWAALVHTHTEFDDITRHQAPTVHIRRGLRRRRQIDAGGHPDDRRVG